ncbi:hypothetical protein Ptr902_06939 [Pyrenophora tritici-repentis]|uniref:Uncharacterized protein n=2 Tax=Pyrenophora tritici-repentis TaxID=45151 RepID=A0A5M9KRH8_9PLEO|nr:uncharacterized protein PTRG_04567 [Pyrenophora tritici-repentis Pt-1C-BFP]KAA8612672.1 hypothetical protein PtrV1_13241 [Pyrenophora tritici-repentis]EDU47474.1 hypothetical protein PTRG_04567 [Pyrenophora tritici-repentis Pt-1C-BFP]KAF7446792.1 hypothetical protein A1F99_082390 [Pyrenophora tritici-repentis]KAF7569068.1 hypothetical protein PtrM4_114830 [Pyrenophora tritici-repentis]KAI0588643.1 hypothetical protein Alg215_00827 [Pyrenophora tritici-repentis]
MLLSALTAIFLAFLSQLCYAQVWIKEESWRCVNSDQDTIKACEDVVGEGYIGLGLDTDGSDNMKVFCCLPDNVKDPLKFWDRCHHYYHPGGKTETVRSGPNMCRGRTVGGEK